MRALQEQNRQLAYTVILRDQQIDALEKEVDQLCLEFLVRQQPAGAPLRMAYSTIRINLQLEQVGDYAESIARQVIKLMRCGASVPAERFTELAERAIQTLHEAVQAYMTQDTALVCQVAELEEVVDALKSRVNAGLVQLFRDDQIPLEMLHPLMTIARRLERVTDQARNICIEVFYSCTGEDTKHPGSNVYRILFVDESNACCGLMATAVGNAMQEPGFVFDSAGIHSRPPELSLTEFMREKGVDLSCVASKGVGLVPHLDEQDVIVAVIPEVKRLLPQMPHKAVFLEWNIPDPTVAEGTLETLRAAYDQTYRSIHEQVKELVDAISGNRNQ